MIRANNYPSHDDVIQIDWHHAGVFANPQASARASFLGASSAPDTYFDGKDNIVGAGDSVGTYNQYLPIVNTHFAAGSQYTITDGYYDFDLGTNTCNVWFTATVAPGETAATDRFLQCLAYEDNVVAYQFGHPVAEPRTGNTVWHHIGRATSGSVPITILNSGESEMYTGSFTVDPAWNLDELGVVAMISKDNGAVRQSGMMQEAHRVQVDLAGPTAGRSSGVMEYDATATYLGTLDGDVTVTLDPSALPAGWDAVIVVGGEVRSTSVTFPGMTMNDVQAYTIRVLSSGSPGVGAVTVTVEPTAGGRGATTTYSTFHNTPAILFVDDDHDAAYETEFTGAITTAGFFSVTIDFNPTATDLEGFDVVVWNTGADQTGTIATNIQADLITFLDAGGRLFLSSQGYLNHQGTGPVFTTGYLGVTAFTQDVQAPTATGVAADPIGDGLNLTLTQPFSDFADAITGVQAGAAIWLNGANGDVGIRYDNGTFRTVFMTAAFEGVAPGDEGLVMGRILDWLTEGLGSPTDVKPLPAAAPLALSLSQNAPNPFTGSTAVRFAVPGSGHVSLSVFNVTGRRVVDLVNRAMDAGTYSVNWDGRDGSGARVADGVYFYRLQSGGKSLTKEMVHLR